MQHTWTRAARLDTTTQRRLEDASVVFPASVLHDERGRDAPGGRERANAVEHGEAFEGVARGDSAEEDGREQVGEDHEDGGRDPEEDERAPAPRSRVSVRTSTKGVCVAGVSAQAVAGPSHAAGQAHHMAHHRRITWRSGRKVRRCVTVCSVWRITWRSGRNVRRYVTVCSVWRITWRSGRRAPAAAA